MFFCWLSNLSSDFQRLRTPGLLVVQGDMQDGMNVVWNSFLKNVFFRYNIISFKFIFMTTSISWTTLVLRSSRLHRCSNEQVKTASQIDSD